MGSNGTGPVNPVNISRLTGLVLPEKVVWPTEHGTQGVWVTAVPPRSTATLAAPG
jgi:hypothetical protein